jgi:fluoroacetyl-CoA thioesterase
MDYDQIIEPGMTNENTFSVEEAHLAIQVGSGAARVLATPWMIAFMERTSHQLIAQRLPDGYSSVGAMVHVRHLAPSLVGSTIRVKASVLTIEKNRVLLQVEAWDETEKIGEGSHERAIIEVERFLKRASAKQGG